ncbi:tetratricopeptide repeat protein [Sandaracinobacteroides hominis]|uniref:tetratricopeptide repeat protein n=1 Tax=Sandaracinobacteroides hominis TaxID=2780086 RepID=UPI0018F57F34|nr:SEL1-like repeat protein [Sandaracinobacteroides hominis]
MNSVIFGRAAIVAALLLGGGVLLAAPTAAPSRFAESAEKAAEMPTSALMQTALAAFRRGDHAEARRSFRLLAQRDIAAAETLLGTMAANGQGGPKDDAIAAAWFLRASNRGYAPAQLALADAFAKGKGVPQDKGRARALAKAAAVQGQPGAAQLASRLGPERYAMIGTAR